MFNWVDHWFDEFSHYFCLFYWRKILSFWEGEVKVSVFLKTACVLSAWLLVGEDGTYEGRDYDLDRGSGCSEVGGGGGKLAFGRAAFQSLAVWPCVGDLCLFPPVVCCCLVY